MALVPSEADPETAVDELPDEDAPTREFMSDEAIHRLLFSIGESPHSLTKLESSKVVRNEVLLASWVPQPSPCCAAASLAGALNALTSSTNSPAWVPADILAYYIAMTEQRLVNQKRKLWRLCPTEMVDPLAIAVRMRLENEYGLVIGDTSKKRSKLTKPMVVQAIRDCVGESEFDDLASSSLGQAVFASEDVLDNPPIDALEQQLPAPAFNGTTTGGSGVTFDIPLRDPKLRWKRDLHELYQYFHLLDGKDKLANPSRPSTAICGNAALLYAVEAINAHERTRLGLDNTSHRIKASLLIGKTDDKQSRLNGVEVAIDVKDDTARREEVWRQLWTTFTRERTVLLFHLKNHYALIFALREWPDASTQNTHRELLTARRGQRPSAWVAWQEAYETMSAWHGYKILKISVNE